VKWDSWHMAPPVSVLFPTVLAFLPTPRSIAKTHGLHKEMGTGAEK
jgi:hypothetical protein